MMLPILKKLCQSIMAEFLHTPTIKLKEVSVSLKGDEILNTAQNLFGIQDENTIDNAYKINNYKEID